MSNVYCSPESHGLELIDTLDEEGLSYEFHMICAWRERRQHPEEAAKALRSSLDTIAAAAALRVLGGGS